MDSHSQHHQVNEHETNKGSSSSSLCRQSSTRWTPTTDQIRILKELYYNNGIRSPTAEQIQRISAKLRQYGKIEGKNVFYWFQNHKARERQKKRFTTVPDHHQFIGANVPTGNLVGCYRANPNHVSPGVYKFSNFNNNGVAGASSGGLLNGSGSNMYNYGYGSVAMEKSFRECSITPAGGNLNGNGGPMGQNISWMGVNEHSYSAYPNFQHDKRNYIINEDQTLDPEEEPEDSTNHHEIETLPLFPMHGDDDMVRQHTRDYFSGVNGGGWYKNDAFKQPVYSSRASLELTLNSCFANFNN